MTDDDRARVLRAIETTSLAVTEHYARHILAAVEAAGLAVIDRERLARLERALDDAGTALAFESRGRR